MMSTVPAPTHFPAPSDACAACAGLLVLLGLALFGSPAISFAHPNHHPNTDHPRVDESASRRSATDLAPEARPARAEARLSVTVLDYATGLRTPVRVRFTHEDGEVLGLEDGLRLLSPAAIARRLAAPGTVPGLPDEAIGVMYGPLDQARGYAFQPDGAFYVDGSFELPVPAGRFTLTLTKGYEYEETSEVLSFEPGDHLARTYRLRRWVDMPARGWWSADGHIHLRRSPREDPYILSWIAAEDVHLGVLLQMGDYRTTYFAQYAFGRRGRYGSGHYMLSSGQEEPRTRELGHTISFGAEDFVRFRDNYYSYDLIFDRVRKLGGLSGYAHQGMTFHGYRGMALDILDGKIDFLEVMQFCAAEGPLAVDHYYRFLDLGYPLTAVAGSDFPWCGRGPRYGLEERGPQIGDARFYTYTGKNLDFDEWLEAVRGGHTFVTTGPMLELQVNGHPPGTRLDVPAGSTIRVTVRAQGHPAQIPLSRLQIIAHSRVLAEVSAGEPGQSAAELTIELDLEPSHGLWIAARVEAGRAQIAHTTPVYVTVEGDGFHTRDNLAAHVDVALSHLREIREMLHLPAEEREPQPPHQAQGPWAYPGAVEHIERRIARSERRLEELRQLAETRWRPGDGGHE